MRKNFFIENGNIMKPYLLIIILALLSCNINIPKENAKKEVVEEKVTTEAYVNYEVYDYNSSFRNDETPVKINYDSTLIVKRVYVTNLNGADVIVKPDSFYKSIYNFPYGKHLSVIEDTNEWYAIKNRSIFSSWVMVYVLKSATGEANALKLKTSDLLADSEFTNFLSISNNHSNDNLDVISKYIDLELISKSVFDKARKHAIKYIFEDSLKVKNKNGDIELILQDTTIRFINNPTDGESRQNPSYVGSINALNSYLIYIGGHEWESYFLIDKNSGDEKWTSESLPYLSPNGKYIICCREEMYDEIGVVEIYNVGSSTIKLQLSASFIKWVPSWGNMFWSSDDCFYVEVYSSFINQSDYAEELKQYIRLRIK